MSRIKGLTVKNRDMLYTVDEILEYTFIVYERDSGTLKELPLQREFAVYLSN